VANYTIIVPPAAEPVSLIETKNFVKQDAPDDDALISGLITAARDWCETYTGRALVTQTWQMQMDAFPGYISRNSSEGQSVAAYASGGWSWLGNRWGFVLPVAPVQSITSIAYNDQGGTSQTLPLSAYNVDTFSSPARVFPVFSTFWPLTQYAPNAIKVSFICGYGLPTFDPATGAPTSWAGQPVPEAIRTAIFMLVSWMYNNRDSSINTNGVIRDNPVVPMLLGQYRDWRF
jgi:uncharacterized phiE125 gp8 family phage protein